MIKVIFCIFLFLGGGALGYLLTYNDNFEDDFQESTGQYQKASFPESNECETWCSQVNDVYGLK